MSFVLSAGKPAKKVKTDSSNFSRLSHTLINTVAANTLQSGGMYIFLIPEKQC
jgi:hypothetical protein